MKWECRLAFVVTSTARLFCVIVFLRHRQIGPHARARPTLAMMPSCPCLDRAPSRRSPRGAIKFVLAFRLPLRVARSFCRRPPRRCCFCANCFSHRPACCDPSSFLDALDAVRLRPPRLHPFLPRLTWGLLRPIFRLTSSSAGGSSGAAAPSSLRHNVDGNVSWRYSRLATSLRLNLTALHFPGARGRVHR
jgi:hypothetical protein